MFHCILLGQSTYYSMYSIYTYYIFRQCGLQWFIKKPSTSDRMNDDNDAYTCSIIIVGTCVRAFNRCII